MCYNKSMKKDEQIQKNISSNITYYRLKNKLTQVELAEKLNYSDKTISKWERAEGMPSIVVLNELASFFNITLNDLVNKRKVKPKSTPKQQKPLLYSLLVWLVVIIAFSLLMFLKVNYPLWHLFILGASITGLIFFLFNLVWDQKLISLISFGIFIFPLSVLCHLTFKTFPFVFYITGTAIYLFFSYLILYIKKR